jgi:Zn-dependent M28 family amino/carboxypeptidase
LKSPKDVIIVEAHLDSVGKSYAGADDNASGIAGLLMIARRIVKSSPDKSFIFFATNGEEQGLHGAKYFVKKLEKENLIKDVKFVINMDMIGYNESNTLVDIETDKKFLALAKWMSDLTHTYTSLTPNITTPAWGSDHVPFINKNIPTLLTIEHWKTKTPCYHARCDLPDHLSYDYAVDIIKLNIAASYLKGMN